MLRPGATGKCAGDHRLLRRGARRCASAQAGGSFASGQRRKPVPTCTAEAPSSSAAATPRASAMPPVAITGTLHGIDDRRQQREQADHRASASPASKAPRWPPASMPCATIASAPAASAALASVTVVTLANHLIPLRLHAFDECRGIEAHDRGDDRRRDFEHRLALRGKIERRRIARLGRDFRSPHSPGRRALQPPPPRRGVGGGSGIQRLSWKPPLLPARTSAAQALIAAGFINSAPQLPSPPALATAIESEGGHAPAIGASRIGICRPWARAKFSARTRAGFCAGICRSPATNIIRFQRSNTLL